MKKAFIFLFVLLPFISHAQQLLVQGSGANMYLVHKAAAHENFYSIGRIYNISPKEIAPYNNLDLLKGLALNQPVRIPLKDNFTQSPAPTEGVSAVPVFAKVEAKDDLTKISTRYNKVPVANLKAWNHLNGATLTPGAPLVIGYLLVKTGVSPLAANASTPAPIVDDAPAPKPVKPAKETPMAAVHDPAPVPVAKAPETAQPAQQTVQTTHATGAFAGEFSSTGKTDNVLAGSFKSTSGWDDKKYYCLSNSAARGTVIRISNPASGKAVFAKVLDLMPDLPQNKEVGLRVSNAAADALGVLPDLNFPCTISY